MKFYCEDSYKSFKDLMQTTYNAVCSKEKNGFTSQDALVLQLFSVALDIQCTKLIKSIKKEFKEDE